MRSHGLDRGFNGALCCGMWGHSGSTRAAVNAVEFDCLYTCATVTRRGTRCGPSGVNAVNVRMNMRARPSHGRRTRALALIIIIVTYIVAHRGAPPRTAASESPVRPLLLLVQR